MLSLSVYVAVIASLNLCIGYVLGVYIGVMPGVPWRGSWMLEDDDQIGLARPGTASEVSNPMAAPVGANAGTAAAAAEPATAGDPAPEYEYVLEGISSFRQRLADVETRLNDFNNREDGPTDDREAIGQCAGELQQANNDYLDHSSAALDRMDSAENRPGLDSHGLRLRDRLAQQSDDVRLANTEIDALLAQDEEEVEAIRQKLIASSEQLSASASEVEEVAQAAVAAASEAGAERQFGPIHELLQSIEAYLTGDSRTEPLQVGAVMLDRRTCRDLPEEKIAAVMSGLEGIVAQALDDDHLATVDGQGRVLLTLPGDDQTTATRRCEQVRQQVAATSFVYNEQPLELSVACAVADSSAAKDGSEVLRRLEQAIGEASRHNENRTFHHDGVLAAPITPQEVPVESMEIRL